MKYLYILLGAFINIQLQASWIDTRYSDFQQGTYDAEIYISRRLQTEVTPQDSGCIEYHARFDVNNDGWYDLVSADEQGPNLRIWLGSASGYSAANCLTYPITSGGDCDISDLNCDGYPELIHSGYTMNYSSIYWGTPTGPSTTNVTLLPSDSSEAVYVADFDKDTYLDIAITGQKSHFYIYWGNGSAYSAANRLDMTIGKMTHNIESADLDNNGYLDLVINYDISILHQNVARNFTIQRLTFANILYAHGLSIRDLNNDGYIDIVGTGTGYVTYSYIFWGSSSGYSDSNKLTLNPGVCYGGSAIADFNKDSLPDILYFKNGKPIIYYNAGNAPYFSDADTQVIGKTLSVSGGTVADFNKDGNLDAFINNMTYSSYSYVFYGPNFTSYDSLPVNRDHHGLFREPLKIPAYYSKIAKPCTLGIDTLIDNGTCSWTANTVGNSTVRMFVRAGNTSTPDSLWTNWYEIATNPGALPSQALLKKYLQYKALLYWDNPAQLPNLERVEIQTTCSHALVEESKLENFKFDIKMDGKKLIFHSKDYITDIEIYDLMGRLIKSVALQSGVTEVKVPVAGIYLIRDRKANINKKIVALW